MLEDKVIIVTGSTTGIVQAIAQRCAEQGARAVVHGLFGRTPAPEVD